MESNQKAIDRVLYYSKSILKYKKFIAELRKALMTSASLATVIPSIDHVQICIDQAGRRIEECEQQAKLFLSAIFQGKDFGYDTFNHFTADELRRGYLLLKEVGSNGDENRSTHVLFISEKVWRDHSRIPRGTLLEYEVAIKLIYPTPSTKIPDSKDLGIEKSPTYGRNRPN